MNDTCFGSWLKDISYEIQFYCTPLMLKNVRNNLNDFIAVILDVWLKSTTKCGSNKNCLESIVNERGFEGWLKDISYEIQFCCTPLMVKDVNLKDFTAVLLDVWLKSTTKCGAMRFGLIFNVFCDFHHFVQFKADILVYSAVSTRLLSSSVLHDN